MANYLRPLQAKYEKARRALNKAMEILEQPDHNGFTALQSLKVTDELAAVFREKPVILIQSMNVKILINRQIYTALRCLDEIDIKLYREAALGSLKENARPEKSGGGPKGEG